MPGTKFGRPDDRGPEWESDERLATQATLSEVRDRLEPQEIRSADNDGVNVTTTTTEIMTANENRTYALFVNNSDATIWLALGDEAEANKGIPLYAHGDSYEMLHGVNLFKGQVNAIHAGSGNKVLCTVEGIK